MMMRRIFFVLSILILLSSCAGREPESRYPVTSAAFDRKNGQLQLTLEMMVHVDSGSQASMAPCCFVGTGDSFSSAMVDAAQSVGRDITFDHMSLALLGESLSGNDLADAIAFCENLEGITPALEFACAEDAGELLSSGTDQSSPKAYEITTALNSEASSAYTDDSSLADVMDRRLKGALWAVPLLSLEEEVQDKVQVKRTGLAVYRDDRRIDSLTSELSLIWRMLAGYHVEGNIRLGGNDFVVDSTQFDGESLTVCISAGDSASAQKQIEFILNEIYKTHSHAAFSALEDIVLVKIKTEVIDSAW